jgi:hypothetical protein
MLPLLGGNLLIGFAGIKVTFDTYGHLFADSEADQRAAEAVEVRLLGWYPPRELRMFNWLRNIFGEKKMAPTPVQLAAGSESSLSAALRELPPGGSGWITIDQAGHLFPWATIPSTNWTWREWRLSLPLLRKKAIDLDLKLIAKPIASFWRRVLIR